MELPTYNKSKWSHGEWDNEPDRVDFIHAGFSCFILRNHTGNWCGYVGVPSTHSAYLKDYNDVDAHVHGGLTYANKCSGVICHIPEPGMSDDVWWLGFDTAHAGDFTPAIRRQFGDGGVYRNMAYTIDETKKLADQLKEMN
jgi:hypothetical protein